jgi:hypothetical protein
MHFLLDRPQLEVRIQNVEFQLKTKAQIAKDFATKGIVFSNDFLKTEQPFETIISELADKLAEVSAMGESALLQLMYTIDLKESSFLQTVSQPNFLDELATLVLRREAFKVYLRENFK